MYALNSSFQTEIKQIGFLTLSSCPLVTVVSSANSPYNYTRDDEALQAYTVRMILQL
jgi:hypothetical protein